MAKREPKLNPGGARSNPGRIRTGISRAVLLLLKRDDGLTVNEILESLGPRSDGVNAGTIWTTLHRAKLLGLIRTETDEGKKKPVWYFLTEGGQRRVDWIRQRKSAAKPRVRAVANPPIEEE